MPLTNCDRCGLIIRRPRLLPHRCRPVQRRLFEAEKRAPGFRGAPWFRFVRVRLPGLGEQDFSLADHSTGSELFEELLNLPVGTRVVLTVGEMTTAEAEGRVLDAEDRLEALVGADWRERIAEAGRSAK